MTDYLSVVRAAATEVWRWLLARVRDHQARMRADRDYREAVLGVLDAVVSAFSGKYTAVGRGLVTVYGVM